MGSNTGKKSCCSDGLLLQNWLTASCYQFRIRINATERQSSKISIAQAGRDEHFMNGACRRMFTITVGSEQGSHGLEKEGSKETITS